MKKFILLIMITAVSVMSFGCTQEAKEPLGGTVMSGESDPESKEQMNQTTAGEAEGGDTEADEILIAPVDKVNTEHLTLLDEYVFDFDNDGVEEKVGMYTEAEKDSKGEIMWDDGQKWLFIVQDTEKDYILADEYVQLGKIDFYVYTIDGDFHIATISDRTASLTLKSYHYDRDNDRFTMTIPFETSGNVNMLHSSAD